MVKKIMTPTWCPTEEIFTLVESSKNKH